MRRSLFVKENKRRQEKNEKQLAAEMRMPMQS